MEYNSAMRKKENLPFATTWMDLEDITFSEISQTEKDKSHLYVESKKSKLVKTESRTVVTRAWGEGIGVMFKIQTCNEYINKSWRFNALYSDYCIIIIKLAERLDLNYSHQKKK